MHSMNLNHKTVIRIILPVCCIVFSGCDFLEDKFVTMMTRLEKKPDESAGNTILDKALTNSANAESAQCDIPPPELLNLEILAENCVTNGMPEKEVLSALGTAKGVALISGRRFLVYDGGQVDVTGGFVTNLPAGFIADVQAAREKSAQWKAFEEQQKSRGLALFEGKWISSDEKDRLVALKREQEYEAIRRCAAQKRELELAEKMKKKAAEKFYSSRVVCDVNGEPIDHSALITKGKITVVVFYLPWCDPWRELSIPLEVLVKSNQDVILKKVDIERWGSLTSKKYNAKRVPDVRVFDRQGRIVGYPTGSISDIRQYIEDAKSRKY